MVHAYLVRVILFVKHFLFLFFGIVLGPLRCRRWLRCFTETYGDLGVLPYLPPSKYTQRRGVRGRFFMVPFKFCIIYIVLG